MDDDQMTEEFENGLNDAGIEILPDDDTSVAVADPEDNESDYGVEVDASEEDDEIIMDSFDDVETF